MNTHGKDVCGAAVRPLAVLLPPDEDRCASADRVLRQLTSAEVEEPPSFLSVHH